MDERRQTLQQRLDDLAALDYEALEPEEYPNIIAAAEALFAECQRLGDATLSTQALIERGRSQFFTGQRQQATDSMREAARLATHANLKTLVIRAYDGLAGFLYDLADYLRALDAWLKCLELASALQDMHWCTKAYIGVGKVYDALRDYESANYFHQMALQLAQMRNDHHLVCQIHINLASVAYRQHDYAGALAALDAAAALQQQGTGNAVWQAEVIAYYGLVHFERGDYQKARHYLEEAQQLYRSHKNAWGQVQVLLSLGKTHRQLGRNEEALEYLKSANRLARQTQLASLQVQTEELLAEIHRDLGQYREALQHHRQMHALLAAQTPHHGGGVRLSAHIARRLAELEQRTDMERLRLWLATQAATAVPMASATVQSTGSGATASS